MRLHLVHARFPKKWEGQWVYIGRSYSSLLSWKRHASGRRHSLGQAIRENAEAQRQPFLTWVGQQRLANNDSLRWWMTHLAGRHHLGSTLFIFLCQIMALKSWVESNSDQQSEVMVVCEDVFLMLAIKENLESGHQVIMQAGWQLTWLKEVFYSIGRAIVGALRQFRSFFKHHSLAKITRPCHLTPPVGEVYLVYLTLDDKAFRQEGKITCRFFTALPEWLERRGKTVIRLSWLNNINIPLQEVYQKLREANCLVPEDWLTLKDYWVAIWRSMKVVVNLKRSIIYPEFNLNKLIFRERLRQLGDGGAMFWSYAPALQRWGRSLDKITFIYTFENMTFEHVQIAQLRMLGKKFRAVGYYHSLVGRDFLGYHFTPSEWESRMLPDVVVTNSTLGKKTLIEQGAPEDRIKVGPALRQQLEEVSDNKQPHKDYLLIPLSIDLDAICEVLETVAAHAEWLATKSIPVRVKPHPMSRIDEVLGYLEWESLPAGWQWHHGEIQEALESAHCCITLNTGSANDALLAGCIVLPIMPDLELAHNVLDLLEKDFPVLQAVSTAQFRDRINEIFMTNREEYIKKFAMIRERMFDGYGRQTDKEMAQFL